MNSDLDPFLGRKDVRAATTLSLPTISRMQRRGAFPPFEQISPGRRGLRKSVLAEFLDGRRHWVHADASEETIVSLRSKDVPYLHPAENKLES